MARTAKKKELSPEEKLATALVPENEQPYKVPENWCWVRLGNITDIIGGGTPSSKVNEYYEEGTIPWLSPADLSGYKKVYISHGARNITKLGLEKSSARLLPKDTVLLSSRAPIGYVAIAENEICTNQGFKNFLPSKAYKSRYLYWYLKDSKALLESYASGTTFLELSASKAGKIEFPLPPLPEQQRIVDLIESLFADLEEAKEKLTTIMEGFAQRKAAILHRAFTGELTEKWREESGKSLSNWRTAQLEDDFYIVGGVQKQPSRKPDKNPVPYITVANVYRNRIDISDLRFFEVYDGELEKYQLKYGDILLVEGNGSGSEIGRCAMWRDELPICIHQNHIIRARKRSESVLLEFVLYYLNSPIGNQIMQERARTTAGLYSLSTGKIKKIPVPQAPIDEQKEIVRILDEIFAKEQQAQSVVESVLADIELLKKSILARAFRGELGTGNPEDERAEELLKRVL